MSVRVSPAERDLLTATVEQAHTNLSDFIRRRALEAAEIEVLERRIVTIPAEDWEKFEAWVGWPGESKFEHCVSPRTADLYARTEPTYLGHLLQATTGTRLIAAGNPGTNGSAGTLA